MFSALSGYLPTKTRNALVNSLNTVSDACYFFVTHPLEAITLGLAAQTATAAAFTSSNSPSPTPSCLSPYSVFDFSADCLSGGPSGFTVLMPSNSGYCTNFVGDINQDGVDDLGVWRCSGGAAYVVFGQPGGFSSNLDVSSLDGTNGFSILPYGSFIGSAGDLNHDGIEDLLVVSGGNVNVLFGRLTAFPSTVVLSTLLDGTNGFSISWQSDTSITANSAGDFNGDGFGDLIVASPASTDITGTISNTGAIFVLFGQNGGFSASFDLNTVDGTNGFVTFGPSTGSTLGTAFVNTVGDINADGFSDITFSSWATNKQRAYVILGGSTVISAGIFYLNTINGTNGFVLSSNIYGINMLSALEDFNGDGIDDALISLNDSGYPHPAILLGKKSPWTSFIQAESSVVAEAMSSVYNAYEPARSVGDLNHDGFSDFAVFAYISQGFGIVPFGVFIFYGSPNPSNLVLENIDGTNGFLIKDISGYPSYSYNFGDLNGDGSQDFAFSTSDSTIGVLFGSTASRTPTASISLTLSLTPTLSLTATPTGSVTLTRTLTPSLTLTLSITRTVSLSATSSRSLSDSSSPTPSITPSLSETASISPSLSLSSSPSPTLSVSPSAPGVPPPTILGVPQQTFIAAAAGLGGALGLVGLAYYLRKHQKRQAAQRADGFVNIELPAVSLLGSTAVLESVQSLSSKNTTLESEPVLEQEKSATLEARSSAARASIDDASPVVELSDKERLKQERDFKRQERLARKGNPMAQNALAWMFQKGLGTSQNESQALEWYQKAALQGYALAQNNLAWMYSQGRGVKENKPEAVSWYRKAAEQGLASAQYHLALMLQHGLGVEPNEKEAVQWYHKAIEQRYAEALVGLQKMASAGSPLAQLKMATYYKAGCSLVPKDPTKAVDWYTRAANQGNPIAQFNLGFIYERGELVFHQDLNKAIPLYAKVAAQESIVHDKALEKLQALANEGFPDAQSALGLLYANGSGIGQDNQQAFEWCQKAAKTAEASPAHWARLGFFYLEGIGVTQNDTLALQWLDKAAKRVEPLAFFLMGILYDRHEHHVGILPDANLAAEYYEKAKTNLSGLRAYCEEWKAASTKGSFPWRAAHAFYVGVAYLKGLGVSQDDEQTISWWKQSAGLGYSDATAKLRVLLKQNNRSDKVPELGAIDERLDAVGFGMKPIHASNLLIDYTELHFERELGKGGFGTVYLATRRFNQVAVKKLNNAMSAEASREFELEATMMARLRSPDIIQFYGYCISPHYCLVMEYMANGSLFQVLHGKTIDLSWPQKIRIATEMACGLAFLHREGILHRDIKSLNVLLDENLHAKLTDFGLSRIKYESQSLATVQQSAGTLAWMAPELFKRKAQYTKKSDVYSYGVTVWEMATHQIPFSDAVNPALIAAWVSEGKREEIPVECPTKLASLIEACWAPDPDTRPAAEEVVTFLRSETEQTFGTFLSAYRRHVELSTGYQMDNLQSVVPPASGYQVNLQTEVRQYAHP